MFVAVKDLKPDDVIKEIRVFGVTTENGQSRLHSSLGMVFLNANYLVDVDRKIDEPPIGSTVKMETETFFRTDAGWVDTYGKFYAWWEIELLGVAVK